MFRKKKESSQQPSVPGRKRDMFLRPFRRDSRSRSPSHSPRIPGSPAPEQQVSQSPHGEAGEGEQGTQQCKPRTPPSQQQHAETSTLHSDHRQEHLNSLVPHADKENHTAHHEPRHNLPTELAEQQQNKISVNLWVEAHKRLLEKPKEILVKCGIDVIAQSSHAGFLDDILTVANQAQAKAEAKRWKFKFGDVEIDMGQKAKAMVYWINKFKDIGDIAIQYDPVHAALPWAGVRFILQMIVDKQESMEAAVIGMERITILVSRGTIYEQLYLTEEVPIGATTATDDLREALVKLYTTILNLLSVLMELFTSNTATHIVDSVIRPSPGAIIEEFKTLDGPESAVNVAAGIVEKYYQEESRHFNKEAFHSLKMLLQSFEPMIARMDAAVTYIYKQIEEKERITILKWFSEVPYRSHHDLAQEGRVKGTGQWFFGRQEFHSWLGSKQSQMLWLHGIPGAGKTKLVSATIDYLQPMVDKVSFFYCKRDEDIRRDPHQILLSLAKQLACPDTEKICAIAQEAYNKEQKDPAARKHLPVDATISLLIQLVDCYEGPIIVLDALDECPKNSIVSILNAFFTIMKKSRVLSKC